MNKFLESLLIPLVALLLSLVLFSIFIGLSGSNAFEVLGALYRGAFGSWFSWQNTLVRSAPLMLTALCTALPARIGLINIGGEGAMVVGGVFATLVGISMNGMPPLIVISAMVLMGMLTAGMWIGMVGALKHFRNVNETISSLLMNYIAIAIMSYLVLGPMRDPATLNNPSSFHIGTANMIGNIGESSIHGGLIFGLVVCITLWVLMRYTSFGFAVDITGGNIRAAQISGLPVGKLILTTCFIGGAAAGIAGVIEVAAVQGRANLSLNSGYGYAGILVAFLARHNPLAIIPVAILLGGIRASSGLLQRGFDLPDATTMVLQGIIFIVILASEFMYGRIKWLQPRVTAHA